jgi:hypothetical protein
MVFSPSLLGVVMLRLDPGHAGDSQMLEGVNDVAEHTVQPRQCVVYVTFQFTVLVPANAWLPAHFPRIRHVT